MAVKVKHMESVTLSNITLPKPWTSPLPILKQLKQVWLRTKGRLNNDEFRPYRYNELAYVISKPNFLRRYNKSELRKCKGYN